MVVLGLVVNPHRRQSCDNELTEAYHSRAIVRAYVWLSCEDLFSDGLAGASPGLRRISYRMLVDLESRVTAGYHFLKRAEHLRRLLKYGGRIELLASCLSTVP